MKNSLFARILILVLCLSLVLCACGKDDPSQESDPTETPTVVDPTTGSDSTTPSIPENPEVPDDPEPPLPPQSNNEALSSVLESIFGDNIDMEGLQNAIQCGKVSITVGDMMSNVLYVDLINLKLVDQLTMDIEGTNLNAQIYLNEQDLVIALPEILPDAYGINLDTLEQDLPNSAIWSMMGITYEGFMAQLSASMDEALGSMSSLDGLFTDYSKCLESLTTALTETLKNVEQTTTTGQANIYGQYVDAEIVTYKVDSAAMQQIANTMLSWCESNANDLANLMGDEEITAQAIIDAIKDAKAEANSFLSAADLEASLVMNFNPETGYLMSIDGSFAGTVKGEDGGLYLNLTLGEDFTQSKLYTFKLHDQQEDGFSITFGYDTVETTTTYTLTVSSLTAGNPTNVMVATLSYDTASYKYNVTLTAEGMDYAINGIFKVTDNYFEFSVDTVTANGEEMEINLRLVAETISSSEIPNAPSYTNVLQMSETELMVLLMQLQGGMDNSLGVSY